MTDVHKEWSYSPEPGDIPLGNAAVTEVAGYIFGYMAP